MSIFSGKCDLYDSLIMISKMTDESDFSKLKLRKYTELSKLNLETFTFDDLEEINVTCIKDLIPYYPFLECIGCHSDGYKKIILSERSFIDSEEEEWLLTKVKYIIRYYNYCKRKKIEPTFEGFCNKYWYKENEDNIKIIFDRIIEHPYKKNKKEYIIGLHDHSHNHFRKYWYQEMINGGYTEEQAFEWVYRENKTW